MYIFIYVCVYVCMYVSIYLSIYLSIYQSSPPFSSKGHKVQEGCFVGKWQIFQYANSWTPHIISNSPILRPERLMCVLH